ncbi:lytic transglycosylase domain-containing protein [Tropicimonas marinistellae]|uniref:lytic transglycosylase domain-containing protein n=1 Tax=Tropicimonas marinistellae TaxID=1739787 RepID=UPI00082A74E1|nr:lytic transglycosylase domain-containing protein [Tropicimonas marinistellae]
MRRLFGVFGVAAIVAASVTVGSVAPAFAETKVSSKSRARLFASQTRLLDSRASKQYANSARFQPPTSKPAVSALAVPGYHGRYRGEFLSVAKSAARKHGVPEDLFLRLVQQESNWRVSAKSHKGAIGLAQLMPGTAAKLGVNPHDPKQNLDGGARYLRMMYDRYGNWRLALAAYNAGPAAVDKYDGVPPYRETKNYVRKIWGS